MRVCTRDRNHRIGAYEVSVVRVRRKGRRLRRIARGAALLAAGTAVLFSVGVIVILVLGHLAYHRLLRPRLLTWGATEDEIKTPLPGDGQVRDPLFGSTRAISVAASPDVVWGFLAQMGFRRGGLYSYDWLDRLFGILDRPSADTILPEFQTLAPGDVIPLGRGPDWPVVTADPGRTLVLAPVEDQVSWSFSLGPDGSSGTRLVSRVRARMGWPPLMRLFAAAVDLPWFVMERKMLLGIRRRAEAEERRRRRHAGS